LLLARMHDRGLVDVAWIDLGLAGDPHPLDHRGRYEHGGLLLADALVERRFLALAGAAGRRRARAAARARTAAGAGAGPGANAGWRVVHRRLVLDVLRLGELVDDLLLLLELERRHLRCGRAPARWGRRLRRDGKIERALARLEPIDA